MKLISYDVGIKNMAYVLFEIQDAQISIIDWNVLNLMKSSEKPLKTCSFELPLKKRLLETSPKICGKKAVYTKNGLCFCNIHTKKIVNSKSFLFPESNKPSDLKKLSIEKLHSLGLSYGIFQPSTCPKTKKQCLEEIAAHYDKFLLEKINTKKEKAGEVDLITLGYSLKQLLNELPIMENPTHVIIENQISPIATRMKTLQGMLAQYYIMKDESDSLVLEFISSSNKLKHLVKKDSQENTYKQHKLDSIHFCKLCLEANPGFSSWKSALETSKKDDLADCFLQGLYYLKMQKLITYAEDLKINCISLS